MISNNLGWFRLIPTMHNAFIAWLYPVLALYIILYVVNLILSLVYRRRR